MIPKLQGRAGDACAGLTGDACAGLTYKETNIEIKEVLKKQFDTTLEESRQQLGL